MTQTMGELELARFVGNSAWARRIREQIVQVAPHPYSVLVTGPSGTGKEVVARGIHANSPRAAAPFIPVNCAAIPRSLFSSQLFGHVKGAFTGAQFATLGCFRAAEGGTIFLDEIGELDFDCQAQLLRVLQERMVTPVGSHESCPVNVRTIVATNRDLSVEVREGRFRLDLYYRLNVLTIETLGLQERIEDLECLTNHFLAKIAVESGLPLKRISPEAMELLERYEWPGNVRELQNRIERAVVHSDSDLIFPSAFADIRPSRRSEVPAVVTLPGGAIRPAPEGATTSPTAERREQPISPVSRTMADTRKFDIGQDGDELEALPGEDWPTLEQVERAHLRRTLHATYYNQSAAARLLNIDRKLLARKIKKYKLELASIGRGARPTAALPAVPR